MCGGKKAIFSCPVRYLIFWKILALYDFDHKKLYVFLDNYLVRWYRLTCTFYGPNFVQWKFMAILMVPWDIMAKKVVRWHFVPDIHVRWVFKAHGQFSVCPVSFGRPPDNWDRVSYSLFITGEASRYPNWSKGFLRENLSCISKIELPYFRVDSYKNVCVHCGMSGTVNNVRQFIGALSEMPEM